MGTVWETANKKKILFGQNHMQAIIWGAVRYELVWDPIAKGLEEECVSFP